MHLIWAPLGSQGPLLKCQVNYPQSFSASPKYNLKFFLRSASALGPSGACLFWPPFFPQPPSEPQRPLLFSNSSSQALALGPRLHRARRPPHFILASFSKFIQVFCVCVCTIFKVFIEFVFVLLPFMFWFLAPRHCGMRSNR